MLGRVVALAVAIPMGRYVMMRCKKWHQENKEQVKGPVEPSKLSPGRRVLNWPPNWIFKRRYMGRADMSLNEPDFDIPSPRIGQK